jgi:hypothetical protein
MVGLANELKFVFNYRQSKGEITLHVNNRMFVGLFKSLINNSLLTRMKRN